MPYLTPQELPEDDDCRPLSIPADSEWLALFGGALTELTKAWNWEDSGGLTVDETLAKMNEIINAWYSDPCAACTTPGDYRVIRIGVGGVLEQLDENGDWEPTTDDYELPPPDAREEGTADDQNCLAAKNATNVLEQLYENLSESFASELSEFEALTAFVALAVSLIAPELAIITWAIAAFFLAVFSLLYGALSYLTADLWDESFTKQMECFLFECANNDAGVVTFDWDCFMGKLNSLTDSFGLSEVQLRLYAQVSYIIYFIGGVDGLNLAGATTEITDDDCSFCECTACHEWENVGDTNIDATCTYRIFASTLTPHIAFNHVVIGYDLHPNPGAVGSSNIRVQLGMEVVIDEDVSSGSGEFEWFGEVLDTADFEFKISSCYPVGGSNYPDITLVRVEYVCDDEITWAGGTDC